MICPAGCPYGHGSAWTGWNTTGRNTKAITPIITGLCCVWCMALTAGVMPPYPAFGCMRTAKRIGIAISANATASGMGRNCLGVLMCMWNRMPRPLASRPKAATHLSINKISLPPAVRAGLAPELALSWDRRIALPGCLCSKTTTLPLPIGLLSVIGSKMQNPKMP